MKIAIKIIKYYPIIVNIYILLGMLTYVSGMPINGNQYVYTFIGQSFITNILLILLSHKLSFCVWHRLLIYNMSFCLLLETIFNFGICINNYSYIVIISTILTIFVSIIIFRRHGTFNKKESYRSTKGINQ